MENEEQNTPTSKSQTVSQGTIQSSTQTPEIPKQKSWAVIGLVILVFLLLGTTGYLAYQNNQIAKQKDSQLQPTTFPGTSSSTVSVPTTESTTSYINQIIRIYPSLNRRFSFYIYPADKEDRCLYGIRDKQGYGHDVSKLLGTDRIACSEGQGNLSSSFAGWADEDKFLINKEDGEIKIIDVGKFEADTYRYDASKYSFVSASRSLEHWLFRKKQENNISYILLDRNKNVTLDNVGFESNDGGVLYDEVNNGFLFFSRTYARENVSVKFDFLSMNTLTLRNILTTEFVEAPGRGCYSEYLISQPGEIILIPGCLIVGEKYYGSDGNIHIKL